MRAKRQRIIELGLWVGGTILAFIIGAFMLSLPKTYRVFKYGVPAQGEVIEKRADSHNIIRYSYKVGQTDYSWGGYAGDIGKNFDDITLGQPVPVYYDPADPKNSVLGDPSPVFYSDLRGALFFSLFPTLLFIVYKAKKGRPWF